MHSQINFGYPWALSYGHLVLAAGIAAVFGLGWFFHWRRMVLAVPADASDEDLERYGAELQATLDRVCAFAEANVSRAGSAEFPRYRRS